MTFRFIGRKLANVNRLVCFQRQCRNHALGILADANGRVNIGIAGAWVLFFVPHDAPTKKKDVFLEKLSFTYTESSHEAQNEEKSAAHDAPSEEETAPHTHPVLPVALDKAVTLFGLVLAPKQAVERQLGPVLQALGSTSPPLFGLVLGELAMIGQAFALGSKPHFPDATPGRLVGGLDMTQAIALGKLKPHIIVATGRLVDILKRQSFAAILNSKIDQTVSSLLQRASLRDPVRDSKTYIRVDAARGWKVSEYPIVTQYDVEIFTRIEAAQRQEALESKSFTEKRGKKVFTFQTRVEEAQRARVEMNTEERGKKVPALEF
ncbi:hypothetical protein CEK25_013444 [Fusarium fujikuroi]|nr:hypothetical protein CEK25_013444 [Fusarium fujikuroi]